MGGLRSEALARRNVVRQRQWRVGQTIAEPHDDEQKDRGTDRAVQIVELILQRSAPFVADDNTERKHGEYQYGRAPMQDACSQAVGSWLRAVDHCEPRQP